MGARYEKEGALRQEAENDVLEMRMRCESAEKMRSECERVMAIGAEQEKNCTLAERDR